MFYYTNGFPFLGILLMCKRRLITHKLNEARRAQRKLYKVCGDLPAFHIGEIPKKGISFLIITTLSILKAFLFLQHCPLAYSLCTLGWLTALKKHCPTSNQQNLMSSKNTNCFDFAYCF